LLLYTLYFHTYLPISNGRNPREGGPCAPRYALQSSRLRRQVPTGQSPREGGPIQPLCALRSCRICPLDPTGRSQREDDRISLHVSNGIAIFVRKGHWAKSAGSICLVSCIVCATVQLYCPLDPTGRSQREGGHILQRRVLQYIPFFREFPLGKIRG
jgi:hypothetical protein